MRDKQRKKQGNGRLYGSCFFIPKIIQETFFFVADWNKFTFGISVLLLEVVNYKNIFNRIYGF